MPDMISTIPGDIGSGGPSLPAADPAPQPEPASGVQTPAAGGDAQTSTGDKGGEDPGKSGAPALATNTTPTDKPQDAPQIPSTPTESPDVQELRAQVETLTQLVGQLAPSKQEAPAAPVVPPRDFVSEKTALDEAFRAEKIDATTYMAKAGELATEQAKAEAMALVTQGNQTTVQAVQAELKKAQDAASWKAMCDANPGLTGFERTPEFAAIKAQNPLHDPLSAYLTHQLAEAKAATKQAVAEAVAAKEKEMVAAIKAKGNAAVLGSPGGQVPVGPDFDAMLKDPAKFGGLAAVQAAKLKQMRAGAGQ